VLEAILVPAGAQSPAHLLPAQLEQIDPVDLDQPRNMLLAHLTPFGSERRHSAPRSLRVLPKLHSVARKEAIFARAARR
jgi:hypothetical protein